MGRLWSGAIGQGGSVAVEEDVMDAMVLDFFCGESEESNGWRHFFTATCADKYSKTHHLIRIKSRRFITMALTS